jgi:glycosyltransferase involved in cell wall biosynthesis
MERRRKKVLILIPTLAAGGAERVVSELSSWAPKEVDLVCVVFEKKIAYPFQGKIVSLNLPLKKALVTRLPLFFLRWWRFRKLLKEERPDSVISFGYSADLINILTNKKAIIRVDMFLSESRKGFVGGITKIIAKAFFKRAELVLVVSEAIGEDMRKWFGVSAERVHVIYNPIDSKRIQELSKNSLTNEEERIFENPVFATMGRVTKQKGQWHLLKAFAHAKKQVPRAQLIVLGEGPMQEALRNLARTLDIADSVHFLGWQENPYRFLARSKMFVFSSLWEGLPMVLLEAMACGLPVVSTDCKSGPREILDDGVGVLTSVCARDWNNIGAPLSQEERELGEALVSLLKDEELARDLSEKSLARARDFDVERVLRQYEFLWSEDHFEARI